MRGDDRLQHEMHQQLADVALVDLRQMDGAHRAAVLRERLGGGAALRRDQVADGFAGAYAKWPTGIYVMWYPVKSRRATDALAQRVAEVCGGKRAESNCLRLEFSVAPITEDGGLTSAGLLIVNPPWTLAGELKTVLPELQKPLGQGGAARFRLEMVRS